MEQTNRVSYIKKPMAENSPAALGLIIAAFVLFGISIYWGIQTQGQIPISIAAVSLSSLLMNIAGIIFSILSFKEKEKNYILARIGLWSGIALLIVWLVMIIIGMRG